MIKNLSSYNTFHPRRRTDITAGGMGRTSGLIPMTQHAASAQCPHQHSARERGVGQNGAGGAAASWVHLSRRGRTKSQLGAALAPCPAQCPPVVSPLGPHHPHRTERPMDPPSLIMLCPSWVHQLHRCAPSSSIIALTVLCSQWVHLWVPSQPSMGWARRSPVQHRGALAWSSQISGSHGPHGGAALLVLRFSNVSPVPLCPPGFSVPFRLWGHLSYPQLLSSCPIRSLRGRTAWLQPSFPNAPIVVHAPSPPFPGPFPGLRQSSNNNCLPAPNPSQVTSRQPTPRLSSAFLRAALTPPAPRGCVGVLLGVPSPAIPFPAGPGAARCRLHRPFPALPVRG